MWLYVRLCPFIAPNYLQLARCRRREAEVLKRFRIADDVGPRLPWANKICRGSITPPRRDLHSP